MKKLVNTSLQFPPLLLFFCKTAAVFVLSCDLDATLVHFFFRNNVPQAIIFIAMAGVAENARSRSVETQDETLLFRLSHCTLSTFPSNWRHLAAEPQDWWAGKEWGGLTELWQCDETSWGLMNVAATSGKISLMG